MIFNDFWIDFLIDFHVFSDFLFFRCYLFSTMKASKKLAKKSHNSILFFIDSAGPSTGRVQKTCVPSPQAYNRHIGNKNQAQARWRSWPKAVGSAASFHDAWRMKPTPALPAFQLNSCTGPSNSATVNPPQGRQAKNSHPKFQNRN